MNYRRGLQRVYLLIAVVWIAGVSFALLSYRWQPWRATLPLWAAQNETLQTSRSDASPFKVTPEAFLHEKATKLIHGRIWMWDAALSLIAPLVLYGVLFGALPWAHRGFRPGAQI
jgi:hypothetical protein